MITKHNILQESAEFFRISPLVILFVALTGLLLSSCANVQVSQDYDTGYMFDNNKSYAWNTTIPYEEGDLLQSDELLAERFTKAIEATLAQRGFIQAAQPTYLVSCTYAVTSRLETDVFDTGFGFGFGRYGRHGGVGMSTGSSVRQYDQGTLVITLHSAETGHLLWKGTGTREVFQHSNPDETTRNVSEMVESVLAQFPPVN